MMVLANRSGRAASMTGGLLSGALMNLGITLAGAILLANMIARETLSWEQVGYGILITLLSASFSGAWLSCYRIKHRRLLVCALSAALYSILLLSSTALFYGGRYEAVPVSVLLIFAGSMGAFFLTTPKSGSANRKKYRTTTR